MIRLENHIILASGSVHRRAMLERAGITFEVEPASVDEAAITRELMARRPIPGAPAVAIALAAAKALEVAARFPSATVIGADQVLDFEGELFSKPVDLAAALAQLGRLGGRSHRLHSGVVITSDGAEDWRYVESATMTMRPLSQAAIDRYLHMTGATICDAVGAYHVEGRGVQLFERIEGDYFTIIGLPLLAVVRELRRRGLLVD